MSEKASPFVPGARVAIRNGWKSDYCEGCVERAYRNGRFTLRGSTQQWRPEPPHPGRPHWYAMETGYSNGLLVIWDETTDAMIREGNAKEARRNRFKAMVQRIERMDADDATDAMLDQIEAALPALSSRTGNL